MPPRSQYGVLHHFTKKLGEALQRQGVICRLLEAQKDNPKPFLDQIFNNPPDCTLSFNGLLPDDQGRFFCDMINIPHVACLVDSPNHFFDLVKTPLTIITCADRFFCDFFGSMQAQKVFFMPHAVEKELETSEASLYDRPYDVVMLSSYIDYERIRRSWHQHYPAVLAKALDEAAEITLSDQKTSYIEAFVQTLDRACRKPNGPDPRTINFVETLDVLEDYIRGKDRMALLQSINDFKVDLFGFYESPLHLSKDNIVLHEAVPFTQALEIMKKSKIVLNSCPTIKNGAHERIFAGILSGALVITSENPYLNENFQEGKDIVFYRHKKWDAVNEKIAQYLAEEKERIQIVKNGMRLVKQNHTWDQRAAKLIEYLGKVLQK